MIAACPKCAARYRIEREKIGEGGVRLRCSRCESVFRVRAPAAPPSPASAPEPSTAAPQKQPSAPAAAATPQLETPAPTAPPEAEPSHEVVVLVAMPDAGLAKSIADHLTLAGVPAVAVFDGVDAMLEIQRKQPKAVILAADLPKMFGFQVCEVVKRNASLRDTRVVLAGAVHHPDRYRRSPSELYGADAYVEVPDLPEGVLPILRGFGLMPAAPEASAAESRSQAFEETRIDAPPSDRLGDPARGTDGPKRDGVRKAAGGLPPLGPDPFHEALGRDEPSHEPAPSPPPVEAESSPSLELDLDWAGSEAAAPPSTRRAEPGPFTAPPEPELAPTATPRDPERAPAAPARDPEPAPVAAPPAPEPTPGGEPASGGGVPISLDFDFGEEEIDPPPAAPSPVAPPSPEVAPPPSPELAEQRAQAERLARIIVSDIVLYNEEKFAAAVEAGTVATALAAELDEGRALFTQRIDERVRREADFLQEELLRVARSRGMK